MTKQVQEVNDLNNVMRVGQILDLLMKFPTSTSIMLSGPPGVGKTAIAEELARQLKARLHVFLAATQDPTDLSGVPHCNEERKTTVFYAPEDFLELTALASSGYLGPAVALFDDITTANSQVFAAYFRLFQQRQIARIPIRDNVILIGTGNRVEDKAVANDLPSPLANRMYHIDVDVDDKAWLLALTFSLSSFHTFVLDLSSCIRSILISCAELSLLLDLSRWLASCRHQLE